jgi:hypothetical protein
MEEEEEEYVFDPKELEAETVKWQSFFDRITGVGQIGAKQSYSLAYGPPTVAVTLTYQDKGFTVYPEMGQIETEHEDHDVELTSDLEWNGLRGLLASIIEKERQDIVTVNLKNDDRWDFISDHEDAEIFIKELIALVADCDEEALVAKVVSLAHHDDGILEVFRDEFGLQGEDETLDASDVENTMTAAAENLYEAKRALENVESLISEYQ